MKTYLPLFTFLITLTACSDGDNPPFCGDNARDDGEICDGTDLSGATCQSLGFSGGALACKTTCADYNRSSCTAPKSCGNGQTEGVEACDGTDLAGKTCEALGFGKGALSCLPNCADFDVTGCGAMASCGNNTKDPGEACDGTDLAGATCEGLGFSGGALACGIKCLAFDKSKCTKACVPDCQGRKCGLDPVCGTKVCGACPANHSCSPTTFTCVKTCDFDPLTANKVVNVDLKVHKVSGTVTINGQQMADDPKQYDRAYLRFSNPKNGDSLSFTLGATGAATYSGEMFAGTYDLYLGEGSSYQKVLPRITRLLQKGVVINADTVKDFDLKTFSVGGGVQLNGQVMPSDPKKYDRAYLRFTDSVSGDALSFTIGAEGPAAYSGEIFEGTYDLYLGEGSSYQKVLPRITKLLAKNVKVSGNMTRNFNLKTFNVAGAVTINGQQMASDPKQYDRAYLRFTDTTTSDSFSFTLGAEGPASYSGALFEGSYDLYLGEGSSYQKVLPRITKLLQKNVNLSGNMTKNFNLNIFKIGGGVQLNGQVMPSDPKKYDRAYLRFSDAVSGDSLSFTLGAEGPATYSGDLFEGTYNLYLGEGSSYQKVLPRVTKLLVKDVKVAANLTKNFNLKTVDISGAVTLNGQVMPSDPKKYDRAYLRFTDLSSADSISYTLGAEGPATYSATIFAGKYDILLGEGSSYQKVLPRITSSLSRAVDLQASATRNFDLKTVEVSGTVTLNGQKMPDDPKKYDRAYLRFTDRLQNDSLSATLGAEGPATYTLTLFASTYDLSLGEGSSYQKVLPRITVPLRTGCYSVPGCTASDKDITASWRLIPSTAYWRPVDAAFKQSGGSLTGTWSSQYGSGTVNKGKVSGQQVTFEHTDNYCTIQVNGTLVSGCLMTGYMQGQTSGRCTYQNKFSSFIGLRLQ